MTSKRRRIAENIHEDKYGRDVRVTLRGVQRTKRFSFEATLDEMKTWQDRTRIELRETTSDGTVDAPPTAGTIADEAVRYYERIAGRPSGSADKSHMNAWVKLYGTWPVKKIDARMIDEAYSHWEQQGISRLTLRHRKRAFREMWRMLYGSSSVCPVTDARRLPRPHPMPVPVSAEIIRTVDAAFSRLNEPVLYAFWRVLATTGQRPCQVNRAQPHHLNLAERKWYVVGAKGEASHTLYLNDDMIAAWKLFIAAKAWGQDDIERRTEIMRRCGWPEDIRPYNLRHTVAFRLMAKGADISDVQAALGHHDPATTMRSYYTHQEKRQRHVSQMLDGLFAEPTPPKPRLVRRAGAA